MVYKLAVGTVDGVNITEHFGKCKQFLIIEISQETSEILMKEFRFTEYSNTCGEHDIKRIENKLSAIKDCHIVLVSKLGGHSEKLLIHHGIIPLISQGSIEDALYKIVKFYKKYIFVRRE